MFTFIVVWLDGDKAEYRYDNEHDARNGERNMITAFGSQISWTGIRKEVSVAF